MAEPTKTPQTTARPRQISGMLLVSLFLSLLGFQFFPVVGPLVGGILAWFGWKRTKVNPLLIGPRFGLVCIFVALACIVPQGILLHKHLPGLLFVQQEIPEFNEEVFGALADRDVERLYGMHPGAFRERFPQDDFKAALQAAFPGDGSIPGARTGQSFLPRVDALAFLDADILLAVSDLSWSPFCVWNVEQKELTRTFGEEAVPIHRSALSADHRLAATVSGDGTFRLYDVGAGEAQTTVPGSLILPAGLALSPDGAAVLAAYPDGRLTLRAAPGWREERVLPDREVATTALAFLGGAGRALLGGADGSVVLADFEGGSAPTVLVESGPPVAAVLGSPDGSRLYVAAGASLAAYAADTGERVFGESILAEARAGLGPFRHIRQDLVQGLGAGQARLEVDLGFTDGGQAVFVAARPLDPVLFDAGTGKRLRTLPAALGGGGAVAMSPVRSRVAASAATGVVRVGGWESSGVEELPVIEKASSRTWESLRAHLLKEQDRAEFPFYYSIQHAGHPVRVVLSVESTALGYLDFDLQLKLLYAAPATGQR